jgi:hypothetical protein
MTTQQHEARILRITATARHTTLPIDDVEYEDFCECRCHLLRGTHTAGQCVTLSAAS